MINIAKESSVRRVFVRSLLAGLVLKVAPFAPR